jgi:hypothetical protein
VTPVEALTALLAAEHAAVWAYGLLGARLSDVELELARTAHDAHRRRRDALVPVLRSAGGQPPVPAPAYDARVADRSEALALAIDLEDGLTVRWRDLVVAGDDPALRRLGVAGMQEGASRAARWRSLAGVRPTTQPFPGRPSAG